MTMTIPWPVHKIDLLCVCVFRKSCSSTEASNLAVQHYQIHLVPNYMGDIAWYDWHHTQWSIAFGDFAPIYQVAFSILLLPIIFLNPLIHTWELLKKKKFFLSYILEPSRAPKYFFTNGASNGKPILKPLLPRQQSQIPRHQPQQVSGKGTQLWIPGMARGQKDNPIRFLIRTTCYIMGWYMQL